MSKTGRKKVQVMPPARIVFTHSREKAAKVFRLLGADGSCFDGEANVTTDATASMIVNDDTRRVIFVVWMRPCIERSDVEDVGILTHEAVHIAQYYFDHRGEDSPGAEIEAYVVQHITEHLCGHHFKWKKKRLAKTR